jgi:hypothetical protein
VAGLVGYMLCVSRLEHAFDKHQSVHTIEERNALEHLPFGYVNPGPSDLEIVLDKPTSTTPHLPSQHHHGHILAHFEHAMILLSTKLYNRKETFFLWRSG